jgi:hypothetical protein
MAIRQDEEVRCERGEAFGAELDRVQDRRLVDSIYPMNVKRD